MPERVAPSQGALAGGGGIEVSCRWRQMDHDSLTCDLSCLVPFTSPATQNLQTSHPGVAPLAASKISRITCRC